MMSIDSELQRIEAAGNLRRIAAVDDPDGIVDLSSNDYLGLADDLTLYEDFMSRHEPAQLLMTASASRLLAGRQSAFTTLESLLSESYGGRSALLFNSGYHANTGIVSALASLSGSIVIADRLVHASIIDGIRLSGAPFERFRHNDYTHLEHLLEKHSPHYSNMIVIVESVYSMDGDRAPLHPLVELKRRYQGLLLYVDEAHAVGVHGPGGLGCAAAEGVSADIDVLVGTLGKALASSGAYAIADAKMRSFLVNRARSLIFSTALPPAQALWSATTWRASLDGDSRRDRLHALARRLADVVPGGEPSHIRPYIVGDARRAVALSRQLLDDGLKVLPIRTPTVPPGTERLRMSLSAAINPADIDRLGAAIGKYSKTP